MADWFDKVKEYCKETIRDLVPDNTLSEEEATVLKLVKNILRSPSTNKIFFNESQAYFSNMKKNVQIVLENGKITIFANNKYYNMYCSGRFSTLITRELNAVINETIEEIKGTMSEKKLTILNNIECSIIE